MYYETFKKLRCKLPPDKLMEEHNSKAVIQVNCILLHHNKDKCTIPRVLHICFFNNSGNIFLHTHLLIAHVPVRTLSVGHNFPHQYSKAPDITSWAELAMLKCFRCRPSHRNLTALIDENRAKNIYSHSVMMETKLKGAPSLLTYQWGSVSWYVVVQAPHKPGEAKIRYFTDQVGVDQHVPGRQVSVNKVSLREVTHPCSNSPEHPDKLEDTELTFVLLKKLRDMMEKKKSPVWCNMCRNSWQCIVFLTLRKASRGPFSMNSVMILSGGVRVITPSSFRTLGWSNCPRTPASLRNIPFSLSDAPQRRVFTATSTSLRPSGW